MKRSLRLLPEARAEFDEATAWYEGQDEGLGVAFVDHIGQALSRVAENPQRHPVLYGDARKSLVKRFPYAIIYREEEDEVIVISIFHTSREMMSRPLWKVEKIGGGSGAR
jgi:plasmid stabilization system protein ParE